VTRWRWRGKTKLLAWPLRQCVEGRVPAGWEESRTQTPTTDRHTHTPMRLFPPNMWRLFAPPPLRPRQAQRREEEEKEEEEADEEEEKKKKKKKKKEEKAAEVGGGGRHLGSARDCNSSMEGSEVSGSDSSSSWD